MSSRSYDKNYKNELSQAKDINSENSLDFRKLMIPFSKISRNERIEYIYLRPEKTPFNERHPAYQTIFRNEFAEAIRNRNGRTNCSRGSTKFSTSF